MSGKHSTETAADGHQHRPVQHRDGLEPWCDACALTADGRAPQRRGTTITRGPMLEVDPDLLAQGRVPRPEGYR